MMHITFRKCETLERSWYVIDRTLNAFRKSNRNAVIQKLKEMDYELHLDNSDRPPDSDCIRVIFDNDADEAAFIVQMSDGLEI